MNSEGLSLAGLFRELMIYPRSVLESVQDQMGNNNFKYQSSHLYILYLKLLGHSPLKDIF